MKRIVFAALLALGLLALVAPRVYAQDEKPFTIHGEVRFRGDYNNNIDDFDDDGVDDDQALFWPYRVRIAAEGHFTKNVQVWIEFQNTGVAGGGDDLFGTFAPRRVGDFQSDVELYQGNITLNELWSKNFSLRIGRQEIVAGNELLLGDEDFYAGISHDGGVGTWKLKKVNVMVWYTRPFEGSVQSFEGDLTPDRTDMGANSGETQHFWGGYATWTWKKDQIFDVYLMSMVDRGTGGNFQTIGARYAHDSTTEDGFLWNLEVAQQMGQWESAFVSGSDVDASGRAIEGWFGYNWKKGDKVHRVYGRIEQATGDDTSSLDDNEGFQPLFGDFHNRTGRGDWFQLGDINPGVAGGGSTGLGGNTISEGGDC